MFTLYEMDVLFRWLYTELAETGGTKEGSAFFNGASGYEFGAANLLGDRIVKGMRNACPACEYIRQRYGNVSCNHCPYDWPKNVYGARRCDGSGGLWNEWAIEPDRNVRKKYAAMIRDLPLKPEYQKMLDADDL